MNSRLAKCLLYLTAVLAVSNAGLVGDLETSRNEIVDLIEEKFENYNLDFSEINGKLKLLRLPELNPNLLQLVLATYNTSTEQIADIILQAQGNPNEILTNLNELFQCELFYIRDGIVKVDQGNVNAVLGKTKDKYIKDVTANHRILGYFLQSFISTKNKTYYPEIEKKVEEIQIPLQQVSAAFQPAAFKATAYEVAVEAPQGNTSNPIVDQLREMLSSVAISLEDISHRVLNETRNALMSFYREKQPENFIEELYAKTINVLIIQANKLLLRADDFIDTILDRYIIRPTPVSRVVREVANPPQLGFLDQLLQNINRGLKRLIHRVVVSLNNLTGSYFVDVLETLEVLLGGLINKIFPDKEMLNPVPMISYNNSQ